MTELILMLVGACLMLVLIVVGIATSFLFMRPSDDVCIPRKEHEALMDARNALLHIAADLEGRKQDRQLAVERLEEYSKTLIAANRKRLQVAEQGEKE